jgi:hypothetical protein
MLLGITQVDPTAPVKKGKWILQYYLVEMSVATGSTLDLMISTLRVG